MTHGLLQVNVNNLENKWFFYIISDETGKVKYTMNKLVTKNPHIPESDETWDKFADEDIERMNNGEWYDK